MMGCLPDDKDCLEDEVPRHRVRLTKGFEIGKYEGLQARLGRRPDEERRQDGYHSGRASRAALQREAERRPQSESIEMAYYINPRILAIHHGSFQAQATSADRHRIPRRRP